MSHSEDGRSAAAAATCSGAGPRAAGEVRRGGGFGGTERRGEEGFIDDVICGLDGPLRFLVFRGKAIVVSWASRLFLSCFSSWASSLIVIGKSGARSKIRFNPKARPNHIRALTM